MWCLGWCGTGSVTTHKERTMKIAIVCIGSRGDVDPFCALGKELIALGHTVLLVASVIGN
jgi:hypothetical protein